MDDETLIYQLQDDLQELFDNDSEYNGLLVKKSFDGNYEITYPLVVIKEIENKDVQRFYDLREHVVDVAYQFDIYADQTENRDAEENARYIMSIIKNYMRGDRYHSLRRVGTDIVVSTLEDDNIKIGHMRYQGRIDIDTNTIYRRK